jgi:hypothetical protein
VTRITPVCDVRLNLNSLIPLRFAKPSSPALCHRLQISCLAPKVLHEQPFEIAPSIVAAWTWRFIVRRSRWLKISRGKPRAYTARRGRARRPQVEARASSCRAFSRGSDLQVRQRRDCATRIPLAGSFYVGAPRAARQPWLSPWLAALDQPTAHPEIARATAFLIAAHSETGTALTRCKQRTERNSNRYTSRPAPFALRDSPPRNLECVPAAAVRFAAPISLYSSLARWSSSHHPSPSTTHPAPRPHRRAGPRRLPAESQIR